MKGINKSMWISENVPDVDVVIDDNPIICGNIAHTPEVASQHQQRVLMRGKKKAGLNFTEKWVRKEQAWIKLSCFRW